jgi:hypothetical protein
MKLKIEISLDNDAFADGGNGNEAARILRGYADSIDTMRLDTNTAKRRLLDLNGNAVGKAQVVRRTSR